jgi:hypothetical protein
MTTVRESLRESYWVRLYFLFKQKRSVFRIENALNINFGRLLSIDTVPPINSEGLILKMT